MYIVFIKSSFLYCCAQFVSAVYLYELLEIYIYIISIRFIHVMMCILAVHMCRIYAWLHRLHQYMFSFICYRIIN